MKSYLSRISLSLLLAACLLLVPACGKGGNHALNEPDQPIPSEDVQEPPVEEPDEQQALYKSPFTGLPLDEPTTQRPLAIMINNAPAARPQSGLGGADIVYELLMEGGITRLVAIYQSGGEVAKVGPIRSIRPYMIELGESYHGITVHAGASNDAFAILQRQHKEDLDEITNAGPYFWRDKSRKAPHNLYSNVEKLLEGADKRKYSTQDTEIPTYPFRDSSDPGEGDPATSVEVKFQLEKYKVSYVYDAESKLYKRFINGEPHKDLDTGEQLTCTNVVILGTDHKVLDDIGHLSINLEMGGDAILLQNGKVIRGTWIRKADDVIRIIKDNVEVPFYPGKTYFNIVPNKPDFESHIKLE
ncbi:DUF3048 domain-containing protein [Paenibacillus sp. GM2]|uniref:DUF3048 domain-containing protein n=1 Tax=Paenibacillus sp. GM2 TaxID=1622070 RepID=UPI0008386867|nr:DUF3048 domain-containing protein [Paenibacillus sp. GM2]